MCPEMGRGRRDGAVIVCVCCRQVKPRFSFVGGLRATLDQSDGLFFLARQSYSFLLICDGKNKQTCKTTHV